MGWAGTSPTFGIDVTLGSTRKRRLRDLKGANFREGFASRVLRYEATRRRLANGFDDASVVMIGVVVDRDTGAEPHAHAGAKPRAAATAA